VSDPEPPNVLARLILSWIAAFAILFDPDFAGQVAALRAGHRALPPPDEDDDATEEEPPAPPAVELREASPEAALQVLGLLQREGRLLDFLMEDVSSFSDADIGGAARVVHEGCRKTLEEHFELTPVRDEEEGSRVALPEGFDARQVRLTGHVVGDPPYRGTLQHKGWRVTEVRLPKMSEGYDPTVVAPAEVEIAG
jgi:hypothetical protein